MKKFLIALLAGLMLLSLSACGKEEAKTEPASAPAETAQTTQTEPAAAEKTEAQPAETTATVETEAAAEPVTDFKVEATVGDHAVTLSQLLFPEPIYLKNISNADMAYRDGKLYVAEGGKVQIFTVDGDTVTFDSELVNPDGYDFKTVAVGADGTLFCDGGVFGACPYVNGEKGEKIAVAGDLNISPNGTVGTTYFTGNPLHTVTVSGTAVTDKGEFAVDFKQIHTAYPMDESILVGGVYEDKSCAVNVYNLDGTLKYSVKEVPHQNNYQHLLETANGVIATTPNRIGFGTPDGTAYEAVKLGADYDHAVTPIGMCLMEDGSVLIGGCYANTTKELILIKMTGF